MSLTRGSSWVENLTAGRVGDCMAEADRQRATVSAQGLAGRTLKWLAQVESLK